MNLNLLKPLDENFRVKVFAVFIVFVSVISLSFSVFFIRSQSKRMAGELIKNGALLAGILAHNSRIGVFSENEALLDNAVEAILHQEGVLEVSVFNLKEMLLKKRKKSGGVVIEKSVKEDDAWRRQRILEELNKMNSSYYLEDRIKIDFWSPVVSGSNYTMEEALLFQGNPPQNKNRIIGLVKISVDKKMMKEQAKYNLIKSILMGVVFLIAGSGAAYFVSRRMTKPLNRLTEGVKALEVGGVVRKVPVETPDEIGKLAKAFNNMSDSLQKREKALRLSEERYRQLCDSLPQVVFETDIFGKFTFANRIAFDLFGYSREDLRTGLDAIEMLIPKDRDRAQQNIRRILSGEKSGNNEYTALKKDGSTFPVLIYSSPITIRRSDIGLRGVLVDLSEFKKVQNALLESESRYRNIVENLNDMIWEVNEKLIYTYVSPQSLGVLGYTPEELLGKSASDFMTPEDQRRVNELSLDFFADPRPISDLVVERISKDGSQVWLESSGTPFFDTGGKLLGFRGVARDITERIRAEDELKQERDRAQKYLDLAGVIFVALNREGKVSLINRKGCEVLGYKEGEVLGKDWILNFLPERIQEEIKSVSLRILAGKIVSSKYFENPVLTKEGNERLIAWHNTVLTDEKGKTIGHLSSGEDITEKKAAKIELEKSREQLRNLSRYLQSSMENERTRISREIHDDLGQYLTALKMDLSWLKKRLPKDQPSLREKEKSIRQSLDTAIDSVERIVSNLRPGPLEDLGLTAAVEWQIGYFQDQTGITCRYSLDREEYVLDSERAIAIYRILQESLTNIARHSNATEVDINLSNNDGGIVLKVTDNGIGISKNKVSYAESFGLMGMRERAYLFKGELDVESSPDKGTAITATIPVEG